MNPKKSDPRTKEQLLRDNEKLKARLAEAEETLRAIREGEVDAIVVSSSKGEQVFSLTGSESVYRLIVETMHEAAFTVSTDGRILYCNRQFCRFIRTSQEKIMGRRLHEFVPPELANEVEFLLAEGQGRTVTQRLVFQGDGAPAVPAHISATSLVQAEGVSICVVATDLSELEASSELLRQLNSQQDALQQSEESFRSLFHYAAVPELIRATDGHLIQSNPACSDFLGYSEEELRGSMIEQITHPDDHVDDARIVQQLLAGQIKVYRTEKRYIHKDGRVLWGSLNISLVRDRKDNPLHFIIQIQDITERKKAEEETRNLLTAIHKDRDRLSVLINSITDEVWFADTEKKFSLANESALQEFRLARGENVDIEQFAAGLEVYRPDGSLRPVEESPSLRSLRGEVIRNLEEIIRTPSTGELRYRQVNSSPVRDSDGSIIGSVSVVRDITELKQAEEELRKSELRYRTVADNTYDFEYWVDPDGKFLYASPACRRIYGYAQEDFFADPSLRARVVHPEDREAFDQHLDEEAHHLPGSREYRIVRPDGTQCWISHACLPIFDGTGRYLGVRGSNRDITDRKQAEEALRHAKEDLEDRVQERTMELRTALLYNRNLIETSLDPFVTIGPDGKITDVNAATESVTGWSRKELIGNDFLDYFTEPALARAGYQKVFQEGFVRDYPLEIRHRDGHITPVLYNASVYRDERGEAVGVFAAARDITEVKEAQAALVEANKTLERRVAERTEELARSNRELEQFAYIASHDLQEPLRSVGGFVNLLHKRYKDKLDQNADEYIGFALDGVTRMQALISDLLTYSRISTRGQEMSPVEAGTSLDRALANLRRSVEESGASITRDALPSVSADPLLLAQLFQNLIGNAIKFRGDRRLEIHIGARRQEGFWLFSVRDNGIGIDPQYYERIFLIFQSLHTREEYTGTGIGLAICKKIVERHGGSIWVESLPGQGAEFFFTIPLLEGNA